MHLSIIPFSHSLYDSFILSITFPICQLFLRPILMCFKQIFFMCEILSRCSVFPRPLEQSHMDAWAISFLFRSCDCWVKKVVFFLRRKILVLTSVVSFYLFDRESVAKLVIVFVLALDDWQLMWVKIVKLLSWCCCYYISWRTFWTCWYILNVDFECYE